MERKENLGYKAEFGNVEIVTHIPQEDLDYIVNLYKTNDLDSLSRIGKGSYSSVYGYKNYAIKFLNDLDERECNDINVLTELQHLDCIPTLYAHIDRKALIVEKIEGLTVAKYCNDMKNPLNIDENFISKWHNALLDVVRAGYSPDDLHEHNVMIDEKTVTPKFVDVGWFFKHNKESFKDATIDEAKTEYGYSRAEEWTGHVLRSYMVRQGLKKGQ
jgi:serine/threonine protein kinase